MYDWAYETLMYLNRVDETNFLWVEHQILGHEIIPQVRLA
jgi:hypothetical protein